MKNIKNIFINFFKSKNYNFISGSNLIPFKDNSLLFTNSGMVQFKDNFLEYKNTIYSRIITTQISVRISGKHNDLNEIGLSHNHNTLFEMLGNFSFKFSSKKFTIIYNLQLIIKFYKISLNNLFITVYELDEESYNIWLKDIKIPFNKIIRVGYNSFNVSENFWEVSSIGLCGPSTEIFYNFKKKLKFLNKKKYNYIEICNIVFIKYNKNNIGKLKCLNKLFIDTGLGLERIKSIINGVNNNYKTNLFKNIILFFSKIIKFFNLHHNFLKIISDHIRTCIFLISDGVVPENNNRGYILRYIIRRILGKIFIININIKKKFFKNLILFIIKKNFFYFNLKFNINYIITIFYKEEKIFLNLLLKKIFFFKKKILINNILKILEVYNMYNTYGFPLSFIIELCKIFYININKSEFYLYLNYQVLLKKKKIKLNKNKFLKNFFKFFLNKKLKKYKIICIYINKIFKKFFIKNLKGIIILNKSLFFNKSCGQSSDIGLISNYKFNFIVLDVVNIIYNFIGHFGLLKVGIVKINDFVRINIDYLNRFYISCNHSALHILNKSLRNIIGNNISKINNFVNFNTIKINFKYLKFITSYDIFMLELIINKEIFYNFIVKEKYLYKKNYKNFWFCNLNISKFRNLNKIRFIKIGSSIEYCKGTHIHKTGYIRFFKILYFKNLNLNLKLIKATTNVNGLINNQKINSILNINNLFNNLKKNLFNYKILKINFINLKNQLFLFINNFFFNNLIILKKKFFLKFILYNLKNIFLKNFDINLFFKNIFIFFIFINNFISLNIIILLNKFLWIIKSNYILSFFLKNFNGFGFGNFYYSHFNLKKNNLYFFFINFIENFINKFNCFI